MSTTQQSSQGGVSIAGLLGVAFVVLKLTGVIDWSWWWVTAPFWGGFVIIVGLGLTLLVLFGAGAGIYKLLEAYVKRQRRR